MQNGVKMMKCKTIVDIEATTSEHKAKGLVHDEYAVTAWYTEHRNLVSTIAYVTGIIGANVLLFNNGFGPMGAGGAFAGLRDTVLPVSSAISGGLAFLVGSRFNRVSEARNNPGLHGMWEKSFDVFKGAFNTLAFVFLPELLRFSFFPDILNDHTGVLGGAWFSVKFTFTYCLLFMALDVMGLHYFNFDNKGSVPLKDLFIEKVQKMLHFNLPFLYIGKAFRQLTLKDLATLVFLRGLFWNSVGFGYAPDWAMPMIAIAGGTLFSQYVTSENGELGSCKLRPI